MHKQLELDFSAPSQAGRVVAFPSSRTALVGKIVDQMLFFSSRRGRNRHWEKICDNLLAARIADGLSPAEARADIIGLRDAIKAQLPVIPLRKKADVVDFADWHRPEDSTASRKEIA